VSGLERLSVAISDPELHAIETVESFETPHTFLVEVNNHGRDAHVHLALDEGLGSVATLEATNVYVERDATREVEVTVDPDAPWTEGVLRVQTGYGAETAAVSVGVGTPESDAVRVDETLGDPQEPPREGNHRSGEGGDRTDVEGWVPVAGLAAVALVLAAGTAALVSDPVVIAGVGVVLLGVVAAGAILLRP
jgi:hypothetical protein